MDSFLIKNAPVLGHFHFESVPGAQEIDRVLHDARFPVDSFHNGVFESRRFREHQHRFIRFPHQPIGKRKPRPRQRCGSKKFPAVRKFVHAIPLSDVLPGVHSPENFQTRGPRSSPALAFPFPTSNTLR